MKLLGLLAICVLSACSSTPKNGSCKIDSDCKDAVCVFGKCQECAVNADCLAGKSCSENRCVDSSLGDAANKSQSLIQTPDELSQCFQSGTIYFGFDQYDVKLEDSDRLTDMAACLRADLDSRITIAGNTDDRGTVEYNLALGEKRAKSVSQYLQNSGISDSRIHVVSYGKEKPVDPANNEEAWARNRRADITLDTRD
ncbi:MAG: peptidoglycan-associated lipoprotein Pal [Myxococcaceae bacterium]|nr:peptidoglycan-associated lipoprotein Pal [Myxococcaceae bacterium]MBH2005857.1 peptidoglycan-associated lipoprotein Pal [Myxococcaceae bacterium]